ncbi:MAG: DUF5067 domain-containing protein [Lachnospiraceae bacterium]|nr:DUF5067 domain-containing protein [Lachnospiraceae bacterium]
MPKKIYLALLIVLLCIGLPGCGKTGNPDSNTDVENSSNLSSDTNSSNNSSKIETLVPDKDTQPEETESPETTGTPEPEKIPDKTPKPKTETAIISQEQQYSGDNVNVKVLGLKEYKDIKGETYTDKAGKGKKFLVLFLSITNNTSEDDYINYNYISAKIDGKNIEHTFLVNDPKSYPTIFTHVPAGGTISGFIVWKVPEDWKKFKFTYNGWKDRDNVSLKAEFTPDDLSDPLIYNANNL